MRSTSREALKLTASTYSFHVSQSKSVKISIGLWNNTAAKTKARANEVSFGADRAPLSGEKAQWKIIRNYRCHVETNYNLKMKRLCFKLYQDCVLSFIKNRNCIGSFSKTAPVRLRNSTGSSLKGRIAFYYG